MRPGHSSEAGFRCRSLQYFDNKGNCARTLTGKPRSRSFLFGKSRRSKLRLYDWF
jgi:hypothetical protein